MYIISDDEIEYSNSICSEEIESEDDSDEELKDFERDDSGYNGENDFLLFKYVCIASLDDELILLKYSLFNHDLDVSANHTIKKILIASKKKLSCGNQKVLNWNNKIIYFIICCEKKLIFFLIGLDIKAYFKNYAFEFLKKLEIYTKSEFFYSPNYTLKNINLSKADIIECFMKKIIKNLNICCKSERIVAVKQKLNKINSVMNNHIDNLYQSRGDIKALKYKTENMSKNTLNFVKNTKKLKRAMLLKYWKSYVFFALFLIVGFKVYRSL